MAAIRDRDKKYHLEMMLRELKELKFKNGTRDSLFIDRTEQQILIELLKSELKYAHS